MKWEPRSNRWRWGRFLGCSAMILVIASFLLPLDRMSAQTAEPDSTSGNAVEDTLLRSRRIGGAIGLGWTSHDIAFQVKPGDWPGSQYPLESATQMEKELFGEIFFEAPFLASSLRLTPYLQFGSYSTELAAAPHGVPAFNPDNNSIITVTRQFRARVTQTALRLGIGGAWEPFEGFGIGVSPTLTAIVAHDQKNTYHILEPEGVFQNPDGEDTIALFQDATQVDFHPLVLGVDFSLRGRIPLGRRLAIHPQVRLNLFAGSFAGNVEWYEWGYQGLLGLSYELEPPPEIILPPPPPMPVLAAKIVVKGVDKNGVEYDNPIIEIEEASRVEQVPVIPYLFFDSAATAIPERYALLPDAAAAARFDIDSLQDVTPMHIHWNFLNVVGERMRQRPDVHLTLTGMTSGDEPPADAERIGRERARSVAGYLTDVWGIAPERIVTAYVTSSPTASQEETPEGREENRRVEFHFTSESMTAPVPIHRLAKIASPPAILFSYEIIADTTVSEWYITVVQGERELLRFDGDANKESLEQRKYWSLGDLHVSRDSIPLRYILTVHDVLGQEAIAQGTFRVMERVRARPNDGPDVEVREFSFVGFKYNSEELLPRHLAQLQEIAREIFPAAEINIIGYTDSVGTSERNRLLAQSRAQEVFKALKNVRERSGQQMPEKVNVQGGNGENFNNELPEGRLLSRMVKIAIARERLP